MKRLATLFLIAALCLGCSLPAAAERRHSKTAQSHSSQELEKKQRKAQKKYAKAQRKAERKMLKKSRKNSHYTNRH